MDNSQDQQITVLGLGFMGSAISHRLLDTGYQITVWNRTPAKAAELISRGARQASTAREAVRDADVVLTLLTNDDAVRAVVMGEDGIIPALKDGATLVDMSTVHPDTSRAIASAVPARRFVDAPILGGPEVAQQGKSRLLLGGSEDVVQSLQALWQDLSSAFYYCGDNGTATTLKLMSNLILVGSTTLLAEAVATSQAQGLSDNVLREVFGNSPAVAPGVRVRLEDILTGDHDGWWTLYLAEKDIRLALSVARERDVDLPLTSTMESMLQHANRTGKGDLDLGGVIELLRSPAAV